jgi:hypothetical protein
MNGNGDFAGMPTTPVLSFTAMVTDAAAKLPPAISSVTVVAGGNDGPGGTAASDRSQRHVGHAAPGSVIPVNAGGDLQSALNSAHRGDTIQLAGGATFTGRFIVPAKNCDNNHWIIVRKQFSGQRLPAEGQRATPCYAGVASLPGRPPYSCPNAKNVMAKVQMPNPGDGPFQLVSGANYYRFLGLEITRPSGILQDPPADLDLGHRRHCGSPRVGSPWLHGQLQDETHNAINLTA